jgi:hypothetical protein
MNTNPSSYPGDHPEDAKNENLLSVLVLEIPIRTLPDHDDYAFL